MAQVTIDVDDVVLRLADDVARRVGLSREVVLARAVRQETAASVLAELFRGREDGLTDEEMAYQILSRDSGEVLPHLADSYGAGSRS